MGPAADPIERPRSPTPSGARFAPIDDTFDTQRAQSPDRAATPVQAPKPQFVAGPSEAGSADYVAGPAFVHVAKDGASPAYADAVQYAPTLFPAAHQYRAPVAEAPKAAAADALPAAEAPQAKRKAWYKRHKVLTGVLAFSVLGAISLGVGLGFGLRDDHDDKAKSGALPTPANPAVPSITAASTTSAAIGTSATTTSRPTVAPVVTTSATSVVTSTAAPVPTRTPTVGELQDPTLEPQPGPGDAGVVSLQPSYVGLFPAGVPTVGDVNLHGIPDEGAATALKILAFGYPRFLQSVVVPVPGSVNDVAVTMRAPNGTAIVVVVDNKFVTANNGTLLQLGSVGGNANWATAVQKAVGKAKDLFGMGGNRTAYFNMANMTESDVFNRLLPNGQLAGIPQTDRKAAIEEGVHSLNTTFNGLMSSSKAMLTPSFEGALNAIAANNVTAMRSNIATFGALVNKNKLAGVGAYDVLVSGLNGVGALVEGFV